MPTEILMPALSPTMEEGKLAKWHVKEGDKVSSGDIIAEIETDKATMEVEAVDEGIVSKLLVAEGTEGVKVNAPIALLQGEDEPKAKAANGGAVRRREPAAQAAPAPAAKPHAPTPPPAAGRRPKRCAIPTLPPARRWSRSRCAKRCAKRWPKKCAATRPCS